MLTEPIYIDPFHPHLIMHRVEGGSFMMGSDHKDAFEYELPVHSVSVPTFYMGKFPVTQSLWEAVMGDNPSEFKGESRPVEQVSWSDIVEEFLPKLNRITDKSYRLPSESEWEFAGRGGKKSASFLYSGSDKLMQVGWFNENCNNQTHPVSLKKGNELGLHDMSGNVWEWCADHWHEKYYDAPTDGSSWESPDINAYRVLRGGSCFNDPRHCRAAFRYLHRPSYLFKNIGFRLALSPNYSNSHSGMELSKKLKK